MTASDDKWFKYKTTIVGKTPTWPRSEWDANRPAVLTWCWSRYSTQIF